MWKTWVFLEMSLKLSLYRYYYRRFLDVPETCLRYEKKSLLGSFSSRQVRRPTIDSLYACQYISCYLQYLCLKSLIGATCWSSAAYEGKILSENAIKLFSLLCNPVSDVRKHVLSLDAFTLLVRILQFNNNNKKIKRKSRKRIIRHEL